MKKITSKFGGSSLADADGIRRAVAIIHENPARRFIVPSAPGKRSPDDKKVTDLLIAWFHLLQEGLDPAQPRDLVLQRFRTLASELKVDLDLDRNISEIDAAAKEFSTPDYLASRGEYLNGLLIAKVLDATFVDPAATVLLDYEGRLDPASYDRLATELSGDGLYVIPGYYGATPDGQVKTFGRGGSDITGAIVARASASELYENWTDVSGFRMTDPRIVENARRIEEITYRELRELAYMGATVLHDEAIFPVREPGIPIQIRNTREPENGGTMIVSERVATHPVCGIAARGGFTMINIEKGLMNREIGFGRRVLGVLEEHGVNFEHMPTGIDTVSVIVKDEELANHGESIVSTIARRCEPDRVALSPGLALIATVGLGMNHHIGVAARLCGALADAGVNLKVIDQGSSEMNIIVGVEEKDLNTAVRAIYAAFESWS